MKENEITSENGSGRILIVDSLRGFSLFGIIITHSAILFGAVNYADLYMGKASTMDTVVNIINNVFFLGKFFAIFSFLFGLSFFIQMDRASTKKINYKWRFLWRIVILLFIGFIHSLIYAGDILLIYAILGIPLVFVYKMSDRILWIFIIILISGIPRFISYGVQHLKPHEEIVQEDVPMYSAYKIYRNSPVSDVVTFNFKEGITYKFIYQTGVEGRAYQTFALFLLGLLVGRKRYFEEIVDNLPLTRKIFKKSIWITSVLVIPSLVFYAISKGEMTSIYLYIAVTFNNLFNLSFALMMVTGFVLLYQKIKFRKLADKLVAYGKMGLSNYLLQSIVLIPLLYGFGLGWANSINLATAALIGILVYLIQIVFSIWWFNRFKYGPFEWFWRSLTWFRIQSFRK